jgi:hypothetical protein
LSDYSEHVKVAEHFAAVNPADCFRQERRCGQDIDLGLHGALRKTKRRDSVGDNKTIDRWVSDYVRSPLHEKPMRYERNNTARPSLSCSASGTQKRSTGADQVVDDERSGIGDVADEQITRNHARASMLVCEGLPNGAA